MAALMIRNELGKLINVQRSEYRMLVHDGAERKALITADQLAQFGSRVFDCLPRGAKVEGAARTDHVWRVPTVRAILEDLLQFRWHRSARILLLAESRFLRFADAKREQAREPSLDQ